MVDLGFRNEPFWESPQRKKKLDVQRYQGREEWGVTRAPEVVGRMECREGGACWGGGGAGC